MAYKDMDKQTSKWVLGGDGITNIKPTKESLELAKQLNKKKKLVKKDRK